MAFRTTTTGRSEKDEEEDFHVRAEGVLKHLRKRGHPLAEPAHDAGKILSGGYDVTRLHSRRLGQFYDRAAAAAAFARQDLARADIQLSDLKRRIAIFEAKRELEADAKLPQWKLKNEWRRDPEWVKMDNEREKKSALHRMLEVLVESLEERIRVLSREITRRQMESGTDLKR